MENTALDYVIRFDHFVFQGNLSFGDASRCDAGNWLDAVPPETFPTHDEAQTWLKLHNRGPDRDGILAKFSVYAKTREANP